MAGVKITTFLGKAPKISPELLPNTAAQVATNCKLYSGDLIPFPQPVVVGNTKRSIGTTRTLYGLRNPSNPSDIKWLSWIPNVDIAVASSNFEDEQRFYYSGDGAPKVSNYALATSGPSSFPFPSDYYDLGLPVPPDTSILNTSAATFTTKTSSSFARDAGNVATVVTSAAHGLRSGNVITVSGFTFRTGTYDQVGSTTITVTINNHGFANGATVSLDFTSGRALDGIFTISGVTPNTFTVVSALSDTTSGDVRLDIRSFNAANIECTVVNSTTFSYFSPGPQVATTSYTDAKVDLGGLTQARSYVFTWITSWDEESIASRPSDNLFIKEGAIVSVTNIPTGPPPGKNFIRGVKLYRSLSSASGSDYFLLNTLWFPVTLARVARTSSISRVTTTNYHNLSIDDRFKISGSSVGSFDITDGIVTNIINEFIFEYAQAGGNVSDTPVSSGVLYYDVSENPPISTSRYWGDGSYTFVDDFDSRNLFDILGTDEYDPPPRDLRGLTSIQNNILAGFVGNTLYFSEPALPHAWPVRYATPIGEDIVALAAISGALLVLTKAYPYIVSVSDPASGISVARIDALYPCLNAKSVVTMGYGIVWSTNDGLAVYSPSSGAGLITKTLYNNDTWNTDVDPNTVIAEFYGENYFASHSTGSFVFEQDTKVGGFFVDTGPVFSASWYDTQQGRLYYTAGTLGDVYEWDSLAQPALTMDWKSKVIVAKDYLNLGAARVVADYRDLTAQWQTVTQTWNTYAEPWDNADAITFRLWVNKDLIFTTTITSSDIFRLPTGYRSDTFEVGVESDVRVRAIHLAETPYGLRTA
jgi:hypothetical protein